MICLEFFRKKHIYILLILDIIFLKDYKYYTIIFYEIYIFIMD